MSKCTFGTITIFALLFLRGGYGLGCSLTTGITTTRDYIYSLNGLDNISTLRFTNNARKYNNHAYMRKSHAIDDYADAQWRGLLVNQAGAYDFVAYTDGSCWNSDPHHCGGAACVILDGKTGRVVKAMHRGFTKTTNNRMEMLAILSVANSVPKGSKTLIVSDSKYAILSFRYAAWNINPCRPDKLNADLINKFGELAEDRKFGFKWVRGHNGDPLNEWCDYWSNYEYKTMRKSFEKCKQIGYCKL